MAPIPELNVSETAPDTLALAGALVFDTAAAALRQSGELLRTGKQESLDLAGVTRVDSAGLACVLAVLARARKLGRELKVMHVPADMLALARVSEVESLLI